MTTNKVLNNFVHSMKKYSAQKDQNKKKYNISENRKNVLSFLSSVMEMSSQALPLWNKYKNEHR